MIASRIALYELKMYFRQHEHPNPRLADRMLVLSFRFQHKFSR